MTSASNNVVIFPRSPKQYPSQTYEEMMETISSTRREHIEYLIDDTLAFVFARCGEDGFDLGKDHCAKPTAMLMESLRSALMATVGLEHPLQKTAETMFSIIDPSGISIPVDVASFISDAVGELPDKE